jgi:mRNA-degrading endonuclease RelE of RelBE toxin-antitoxin system
VSVVHRIWSYRVGDHRIVYTFNDAELWVLVVLGVVCTRAM